MEILAISLLPSKAKFGRSGLHTDSASNVPIIGVRFI